jgi:hypothetical protein
METEMSVKEEKDIMITQQEEPLEYQAKFVANEDAIIGILEEEQKVHNLPPSPTRKIARKESIVLEMSRGGKIPLIKNIDSAFFSDNETKTNYTIMLFWASFFCDKSKLFSKILELAPEMRIYCTDEHIVHRGAFLQNKELNSRVILAAIKEKEEIFLLELLKMGSLQYTISIEMVVALLETKQHNFLKLLFKSDLSIPRSIFSLKATKQQEGFFQEFKKMEDDPEFLKETLNNIITEPTTRTTEIPLKAPTTPTNIFKEQGFISRRNSNVVHKVHATFKFKDIFPHLVRLD